MEQRCERHGGDPGHHPRHGAPPRGHDNRDERGEGGLGTKRGVNPAVGEDVQDPARHCEPPPGYKNTETSLQL